MNILETDRLILSQLSLDDVDFILELLNEPAFHEYIGDKEVRTVDDASDYLKEGPMASYKSNGYGLYLVSLKVDNTSIGICGIKTRNTMDMPELGYAFLKRYWSKGYATEAARGVMDYAHDELGLKDIAALTSPENTASIRVLEKLGFEFDKIIALPDFETDNKLFIANR